MDPGPRGSIRESVLLQAYGTEEALTHVRSMLEYKAPLLDRTDSADLKRFNELVDKSFSYAFPENNKKAELPTAEFDKKVDKFVNAAKGFKRAPKQIQNYKKKV